MTTEHTPGPWAFEPFEGQGYGDAEWAKFVVKSEDDDNFCLATVIGDVSVLPAEANARIIAAAPILLQKLKNCVTALTFAIDGWDETDPFIAKLRATRDGAAEAISASTSIPLPTEGE